MDREIMTQTIQFIEHQSNVVYKKTDSYAINKRRKAVWLQKACCWILRKLDCEYYEETVKVTRIEVDPMKFMQEVFRQKKSLASFFREDGKTLLIGAKDFEKAMDLPEMRHQFQFRAQFQREIGSRWGEVHCMTFGLNVVVVPWLRGMVVLP